MDNFSETSTMIEKITFKAGPSPQSPSLSIEVTPITVFVGPNNAGKSRVLIELESWSISGDYAQGHITKNVEFSRLNEQGLNAELETMKRPAVAGESRSQEIIYLSRAGTSLKDSDGNEQIYYRHLIREAVNGEKTAVNAYATYRKLFTLRLDGNNRLNLLSAKNAGDFQAPPTNALARLFRNNQLREQIRTIIYDAFKRYFVIDPTNPGQLRVRLAERSPVNEAEERNWDSIAVAYHGQNTPIEETSDGVRAFTGIITALITGDPKITLIDEPEAFLHPALAMKLGKEVATIAAGETQKRLFVSTHSASFLMGCIQSSAAINIVRLTYKSGVATTRVLNREQLVPFMRNPMLRSTGMLEGLFYEAVIVTEGDSDRAFYQEINERLRSAKDVRGLGNCLFINAQNKQTIWDVVRPLRELGIPAIGIVDLDVLKEGGKIFSKLTAGAFFPSVSIPSIELTRANLLAALNDKDGNWKRSGGIGVLSVTERQGADTYFDQLEAHGVFVVRPGEVEAWMGYLGVPKEKQNWLPRMFEAMGEDPTHPDYVQPQPGDVWEFIGRIREWVDNPNRKGIPE
ncbi:ATP-dependent endonuclease [Hymenobacter sp. BT559]|uniref:ATP-dependent nuclease n=1 Tax=Hymenobacter sp. BT559 TaxID=2795729 RepID=UPI0018ED1F76|nr:ATP-binding protein [Hymenobacter sp. BT559]MBJ6142109.1 ATP-binding protein [Hymenobacter sp. BT559]